MNGRRKKWRRLLAVLLLVAPGRLAAQREVAEDPPSVSPEMIRVLQDTGLIDPGKNPQAEVRALWDASRARAEERSRQPKPVEKARERRRPRPAMSDLTASAKARVKLAEKSYRAASDSLRRMSLYGTRLYTYPTPSPDLRNRRLFLSRLVVPRRRITPLAPRRPFYPRGFGPTPGITYTQTTAKGIRQLPTSTYVLPQQRFPVLTPSKALMQRAYRRGAR